MDINFSGKRALVTGAGQGIGRAIVFRLVQYQARVVAFDKDLEGLEALVAELPEVEIVQVDLCDWSSTKRAAEAVGDLDLLVNCAGVALLQPFGQVDQDTFDKTFGVNLKAVINLSQVVATRMISRKVCGSIVNISSQASKHAIADHTVYNASKAGVDMVTKCMALELGPKGIRTNAVNPTIVNTALSRRIWEKDSSKKDFMLNRVPLGKFCVVEDVVDATVFLLSERASMINGAILSVDGGATAC